MKEREEYGKIIVGISIVVIMLFPALVGVTDMVYMHGKTTVNDFYSYQTKSLKEGLVAYWNFDEGSGNVLHDVSGNWNDGIIYGAKWVDGISGKALSFNGEDSYVKIPNSPTLNPRNATFEAFVYINSYPRHGNASGILFKYKSYQVDLGYTLTKDDKCVWFGIWGDHLTGGELTLRQWHQITVTFSQTGIYEGIAKLYIDGKLVVSEVLMDEIDSTTNPLIIGYKNDSGGGYFNGLIDEVRIYNRALSADEVSELYNQYIPKNSQNYNNGNWMLYFWLIIVGAVIAVIIVIILVVFKEKGKRTPPSNYYDYLSQQPPYYSEQPPQGEQKSQNKFRMNKMK